MICPACGAEYRPGFTECSDCLVPLVEPVVRDEVEPEERPADEVSPVSREPLSVDAAMICPQCGAQYRAGFIECSDCLVALVEPEPATGGEGEGTARRAEAEPSPLVTVFTATGAAEAALVRATLESAGLPVLAREPGHFSAGKLGVPGMAGSGFYHPVEFQVREKDVAKAQELLDGLMPGSG